MKSIDTGRRHRETLNPWDEGDYKVYGYAVKLPGGVFGPAYVIDRVRSTSDVPKVVVPLHEIRSEACKSENEAKLRAIEHGVNRVRTDPDFRP